MIKSIRAKLAAGDRLGRADALYLLESADLLELGQLAARARFERHPDPVVTYVVDTNLNYTNICDAYCSFCAFYRPPGSGAEQGAYTHTADEIVEQVGRAAEMGCTTVLMQGGLHPNLPLSYYTDMVSAVREAYPQVTPHFWSAPEIFKMAQVSGQSYEAIFEALWDAGQRTLPGGGAEVLTNRARHKISPLKMDADEWIAILRAAHGVGFTGTATMMYGHVESPEDIVEHLDRIRQLQDEPTPGYFHAFVPWSFSPGDTPLGRRLERKRAGPNQYLRILALARLFLDNFDHIDASWFSEGKKTGQIALQFGADDFGGTLFDENVMNEAGHYNRTTEAEVQVMIREAGFQPARRDTKYRVLEHIKEAVAV